VLANNHIEEYKGAQAICSIGRDMESMRNNSDGSGWIPPPTGFLKAN
jgi:hypothetical protein